MRNASIILASILFLLPNNALADECKKEDICAMIGKFDHFGILDKCPNAAQFLKECKAASEATIEDLPAAKFVDNKDGTITDTVNKLLWLKQGILKKHSLNDAKKYALTSADAGKNGWRLPTLPELKTLLYKERTINSSGKKAWIHPLFDDGEGHYYWTTTTCDQVSAIEDRYQKKICHEGERASWLVHFNINAVFWHFVDSENYFVWLVQNVK
jgi:hypothetical protein